jgi:thiamine-phosphate pyrophosphorylase
LLLYYITDRKQLSADPDESLRLLLDQIASATRAGVDLIQIREKDLPARKLVEVGIRAAEIVRERNAADPSKPRIRLLINARIDVAIACGADAVHLRSDDMSAADARCVFSKSGISQPVIGVSCHTIQEVELAEGQGADFALFGPVFEKAEMNVPPKGTIQLDRVCHRRMINPAMPVIAVGGVNLENALQCLRAGAAGIAAIRLFQTGNMIEKVSQLRRLAA